MPRLTIAANWKMNIAPSEAGEFADHLREGLDDGGDDVRSIVCPPFLSIPAVSERLRGSNIRVGAQNMHFEPSGAYTGEVSPAMVKELCDYVILGHSERRAHFGETDEMVAKKAASALAVGLNPIVCVGETLLERESGDTQVVIQRQLRAALREARSLDRVILAYEPVWAIGSGVPANPADAQAVMEFIRGLMYEDFGNGGRDLPLLYGGSVAAHNVAAFVCQPDIDGCLVGSASLDPAGMIGLVQNALAAFDR